MHAASTPADSSSPTVAAAAPAAGQPFTEADLIAADVQYLEGQRERDARRLAETMCLERAYVARRGWGL